MILFILPSMLTGGIAAAQTSRSTILVCYGRLNPVDISGYSYVILESQYYNAAEIKTIKAQNDKVVAYISVGEVNANAKHFHTLKNETLGKNSIWNSYYLNMNSDKTRKVLMDLIGEGLALGYDGFFLDNIDNFTSFGPQALQKPQLISFLQELFAKYPNETFVQNAGLEIIDQTAAYIDALLIESIATDYSFDSKTYKLRADGDFRNYAGKLRNIREKYKLPVILVEYADTAKLHDAVTERIKPLGFEYFIGNIDLQTIPKFR